MENILFKKSLVLGIIILFVGISFSPAIRGVFQKTGSSARGIDERIENINGFEESNNTKNIPYQTDNACY